MGAEPLRIRFDKANGIPNIYNGIRSLELSNSDNKICYRPNSRMYNAVLDMINEKWGDKCSINHKFARIGFHITFIIDPYNSLPIEKKKTFHNVVILFTDKNNYNYKIFLEQALIKICTL